MIKKIIIFIIIILFLSIASVISPPYAADKQDESYGFDTQEDIEYEIYESEIWSETHNSVNKSESHFFDLGTRTSDGSMHIYIKSQAPASNYDLKIESVKLNNSSKGEGIYIKSNVEKTDDIGSTVITDLTSHIELKEHTQTDSDYVTVEITDGWNETKTLTRDSCGCVLEKDPRPDN